MQQAFDALLGKVLLPAPDRRAAGAGPRRRFQHRQALGREQHDPGKRDVLERTPAVAVDARQPRPGGFVKENTDSLSHPLRHAYLTAKVNPPYASPHSDGREIERLPHRIMAEVLHAPWRQDPALIPIQEAKHIGQQPNESASQPVVERIT